VAMIGQALAQARGLITKHAIKQVDRLLSNNGIDVWDSFARWVAHQIGERRDILVAMDWTDFDYDAQSTLALHLVTGHGLAAPAPQGCLVLHPLDGPPPQLGRQPDGQDSRPVPFRKRFERNGLAGQHCREE